MYYVNYNLRNPKAKTKTLIFLYVTNQGERLKLSTRESIEPHLWNQSNSSVTKSMTKLKRYENLKSGTKKRVYAIQNRLDSLRKEVDAYMLKYSMDPKKVKMDELKDHLQRYLSPTNSTYKLSAFVTDYLKVYLHELESGYRKMPNGANFKKSTTTNYKWLLRALKKYENHRGGRLRWDHINKQEYIDFIKWHEIRGNSINYTGRHIKELKCIMRAAYEDGVHENDIFRNKFFVVPKDNKKKIPLTAEEVKRLEGLPLLEGSKLDLSRDIFLLGCYLGLRVSDLKRISPERICNDVNGCYLNITTQKTGKLLKIPVNSSAQQILTKYDYNIPNFWEQVINRNIKILGKEIGLPPKRTKKLSLHVSRCTFARMAYEMGIPSLFIMQITGHATEKTFLRYINITSNQAMEEFRKHSYFQ